MNLIEFPEQTVVIAKDQPEYMPLPVHRFADDPPRPDCLLLAHELARTAARVVDGTGVA